MPIVEEIENKWDLPTPVLNEIQILEQRQDQVGYHPTRTSRNHTGFKKLIQIYFFVNTQLPWVYKEVKKYFAHFAQN